MAKMKKKQQNEKLYCPYCGRLAVLRPAGYVYGKRNLNPDNYLYVCSGYPSCDSYIGVHKKSMLRSGSPPPMWEVQEPISSIRCPFRTNILYWEIT